MSLIEGIEKVSRPIDYFVVHCADTKRSMDVDIERVRKWHVVERGWSDIGYNLYIRFGGGAKPGRPLTRYGAHEPSVNKNSIGICLEGGMGEDGSSEDTLTVDQWRTVIREFREAQKYFPGIKLAGHNQFSARPCPSFDVREYGSKHGLKPEEIYQKEPFGL